MEAEFTTNKGRKTGEIIRSNVKTVWVKLKYKMKINLTNDEKSMFENKERIIKRHKIKHNVVMIGGTI